MPLTKDERDWVEGQLPIFIQHQNQKMVADFWPRIRAAFFLKFPLDGEDNPAMDVESRSALGKISDSKFSSLKHYFNNTSINNSTRKSRVKAQEAVKIYFGASQIQKSKAESECKEKVDAAIAAFGPAITKGDRMVIRNKHTNAGYQAAQLDPVKMATIEKYLAEENSKRNEDTTSPVVDEDTGEIQKLTGKEHVKFMRALPTTLAEVSTRLAKLGGLCTMFVAAGMDPDNENKIRGYGFHVGKDVHGQPFFRAIPDYTERVLRPFLNFASAAFVAEDNPSTTSLSTSADRDTSEVANSPPLTVVADGSESLPVSSEHPAGASPTACATESMSEITATPIAPSHDTSIGLTDPPSDILPTLSSPFPILSSPMPTSSFPLDNCGELPVMPTSPTLPTPTVSSAILGTPPVVVTPSCQPMTRSLSYPLIPFQPEEQSSHSTRSLSLPPPSSADVSLSLLLGDSSTARAVDQLPEPVSQAPQSYSWSRMTDHEFDAVIATGLNNNQLFEWDSTGALPELNQPVGPLIGEKTGSMDSGLSVFPFAQDIDSNALIPGSPTIGPTIAENVGSMNSGLLAFPFAQDINSNSSTPGPPTIGPPIVENIEGVDGGLLAFPFGSVASIAGPPTLSPPIVGNSRLAFPSAQDINMLLSTTSNVFDTEVPDPLIVKSTVDTGNDMSSLGPMVPDSLFAGSIIQVGAPSVLSPSCVTSSSSSSDPPMGNTQTSPAHSDGDGLLDMLVHPSSSDPPIGDTQMSPAHSDGTILASTSNSNVPTGGAPTGPARAPTSSLKAPTGGVPTGPALLAAMLAKEPALLSSLDADHPDIFVDGMSTDVAAEITTGANAKDKAAGSQRKQAQKKDTTAAKSKKGTKVISKPPVEEKANEKSSNSGSVKIVVGESGKIKIVFGSGESAKGDMSNLGDGGGAMKENTLPSTMERSARPQRSHKEAPSREPITIKEMNIRRMATKRSVHEAGLNVDSDSSKKAKQV